MINITDLLSLHKFSSEEVSIIFSNIVGSSHIPSDGDHKVVFGAGDIRVTFKNDSSRVLRVEVLKPYWETHRKRIIDTFNKAAVPASTKIDSRVVFSAGREVLFPPFRWKDKFQLGRMPEGNPKSENFCYRQPNLFQFRVSQSGIHFLDSYRAEKTFKASFLPLVPILAKFSNTQLYYDLDSTVEKAWVIKQSKNKVISEWVQLGYFPETSFNQEDWHAYTQPDIKHLPVSEIDLYWPSSIHLSTWVNAFELLPGADKELFLLGCEWFIKSSSASNPTDKFLFMMIMLEIFLPNEASSCEECGQPKYGIRQNFKTMIPDIIGDQWTENFTKVLNDLYTLRSKIAHEGMAVAKLSTILLPSRFREETYLRYLSSLGQQFLVSWLMSKAKRTETLDS